MGNLIVGLFLGGLLGWIVSLARPSRHGDEVNFIVGMVCTPLFAGLAAPFVGTSAISQGMFNLSALLLALLGTVTLLLIVDRLRRRSLPPTRKSVASCCIHPGQALPVPVGAPLGGAVYSGEKP
ncbi:hypothetical protein FNU76_15020 [Chitinimonas arctica]|uniref:GlsB/YeaQ/YmgE family stress response membrane protein n=1 Tax=Chitinimonas arctica TaxID=2594795 RepID=A0A516SHF7_9NEIS|nr:hypothetical protein [Chitinimonas arctica]QDQ27560.1 hypothetical protein FNU76_15020 [Chitinimonas arctica]